MILVAHIDGWLSALDEVPDSVFSGKLMGDGLAIDPTTGTLCAPCDGEVLTVHAAKHAVTLRAPNGAEILLHVGCDTVALRGDGFAAHVGQGQRVRAGDALLTFDLDGLAPRVRSLVTPVIVMGGFEVVRRESPRAVRVGDFLMELRAANGTDGTNRTNRTERTDGTNRPASVPSVLSVPSVPSVPSPTPPELRKSLRVPYEHGIHARPAALLAAALRGFSSAVTAQAHGRSVNARSPVAWMELGAAHGDEVTLIATGADAAAALAALEATFAAATPHAPDRREPTPLQQPTYTDDDGVPRGVIASRGIAIGPACVMTRTSPSPAETGAGTAHETTALDDARTIVRTRLTRLHATASGVAREVLEAHLSFLDDPELLQKAQASIARGKSAGFAWREALEESAHALLAVGDPWVAERADDLRDLAGQVLRALAGEEPLLDPPAGSILIGHELLPSQLAGLPPGRIAGFCTAAGGPTSHVALLAAAMNLPALVAAGPRVLSIADGTPLVLDADEGVLRIAPDAATLQAAQDSVARHRMQREAAHAAARTECRLASGERIEVFANAGALADISAALDSGAEGCGLLRTEFLFLDRDTPPDVEEQTAIYQSIVTACDGRPVAIRTLDGGSDKPLRYLPSPREENPALGVRGIRASLRNRELLRGQLHAILLVEPRAACRILLPMITDVSEVRSVREMVEELCGQLGRAIPPIGVMIETPASALLAAELAAVADFLSIGSNDLAQYTLAMDRGQAELAAQLDALHPAVLRLMRIATTAARAAGRPIAVCGGLASDPVAAPILIGLGIHELSAVPSAIPELKATLRALQLDDCRALAERALAAPSAAAVRALVREAGGKA
ncbi:MAG TPA: phosphoenolpyruvate--protein phosphotransferase [Thermoanaerobaculia bacterium]